MARGRTRLTTPPGDAPRPAHDRISEDETYMPAFALPEEPRYPSRWRRLIVAVLLIAAVGGGAYWGYLEISSRQAQDPALTGEPDPAATATP